MSAYRKFCLAYLLVLGAICIDPAYKAAAMLGAYLRDGSVLAQNYPSYIIPYAPLCVAVFIAAASMPLFLKPGKKNALLASTLIGIAVFFVCETGLERIGVAGAYGVIPVESWQYSLCVATPEVLESIGAPLFAANNPAFKVHFYLIALVILVAALNVIYQYSQMILRQNYDRKLPAAAQLISVTVFIGLCVLACATAFYRTGTIDVPPISAVLMAVFFVVFGVTFGTYFGCLFYGRGRLLSVTIPAIMALATTLAMYGGELLLMDGALFRPGSGWLFAPLGPIPFAPADMLIILLSGAITHRILSALERRALRGSGPSRALMRPDPFPRRKRQMKKIIAGFWIAIGLVLLLCVGVLGVEFVLFRLPPNRLQLIEAYTFERDYGHAAIHAATPRLRHLTSTYGDVNRELASNAEQALLEYQRLLKAYGDAIAGEDGKLDMRYGCEVLTDTDAYFSFRTFDLIRLENGASAELEALQREAYAYYSYVQSPGRRKGETYITDLQRLLKDRPESYTQLLAHSILEQIGALPEPQKRIFRGVENADFVKPNQSFYINSQGELVIAFEPGEIADASHGAQEFIIPEDLIGYIRVL